MERSLRSLFRAVLYDRGKNTAAGSPDCGVGCDCDRFMEFWNLVFTQFDPQAMTAP